MSADVSIDDCLARYEQEKSRMTETAVVLLEQIEARVKIKHKKRLVVEAIHLLILEDPKGYLPKHDLCD